MWAVFVLFETVKSLITSHFRAFRRLHIGVSAGGKSPRNQHQNGRAEQIRLERAKIATPPPYKRKRFAERRRRG